MSLCNCVLKGQNLTFIYIVIVARERLEGWPLPLVGKAPWTDAFHFYTKVGGQNRNCFHNLMTSYITQEYRFFAGTQFRNRHSVWDWKLVWMWLIFMCLAQYCSMLHPPRRLGRMNCQLPSTTCPGLRAIHPVQRIKYATAILGRRDWYCADDSQKELLHEMIWLILWRNCSIPGPSVLSWPSGGLFTDGGSHV